MRAATSRIRRGTLATLAFGASVAALAGCTTPPAPLDALASPASDWSSAYADARNSSLAPTDLPDRPSLRWSRDLGAPLPGPAVFDGLGTLRLSTLSDRGCNAFSLSIIDGRKSWCSRQATAGPRIAPQLTTYGDSYWPVLWGVASLTGEGEFRWGTGFPAAATTARQLTGPQVLLVNSWGQARILSALHGEQLSAPLDLGGPVPAAPPDYGLAWCETGTRGCPSPAPAAVVRAGDRFYLTVWKLGEPGPDLVAVDVRTHAADDVDKPLEPGAPNSAASLHEAWRVPLEHGRTGAPVVLSADERTAYVASAKGLAAYDTADGSPRWFHATDVESDFAPAVGDDGTIVLGGRTGTFFRGDGEDADASNGKAMGGGALLALRDDGDHAQESWRAADAASLTAPVLTRDGSTVVAARTAHNGVSVRALDSSGAVRWEVPLPDAEGPVGGLSVDAGGNVAVSLAVGRVYFLGRPL